MPLTEISANVSRNGNQAQRSIHASAHGHTPNKKKPDAVSSMLKTSTETGDIDQFSVRPSRLPRSASRLPARSRSGSANPPATSFRPSARRPTPRIDSRHLPRPVPSFSALSRHDTVRSNLTSYHSNPRTRSRAAPRAPYGPDRRPSPAIGMGLHSHSSFMTLRGRSGYRPASPAFSDAQTMPMYSGRPSFHRAASVVTAASSPGSLFHREPPYSYRDMNNSAASIGRFPSPAMPGAYPGMRRSPFPSRNPTPLSAFRHNSMGNPNRSVESFHTMHRSATGSTTPLYYDYTEAFMEEYSHVPDQDIAISPLFSADHAIPEQEPARPTRQAQTPFGMMQGSAFKPSEMPTDHNRTTSEQSKQSIRTDGMVQIAEQKTRSETVEDRIDKAGIATERISRYYEQGPEEMDPRRSSGLSRRTCSASPSTSFFPNASRNSRDLTSLAARVHSPTPKRRSIKDVKRMQGDGTKKINSQSSSNADGPMDDDWQLPSLNFRPLSFLHDSQGASERSRSSGPVVRSDPPTIISPTPGRPMSSQSRRRFSKILGMEDYGCSHVQGPANFSRSYNSLNAGKLKRVLESSESIYSAKYSIPPFSPRNSIIAESTKDNESNFGSTDQEQGSGCEKSTVESLLDKHIECLGLQPEVASEQGEDLKPSGEDGTQASTNSTAGDESTVRLKLDSVMQNHPPSRTVSSANASRTASPKRQTLMPKKLFSPEGLVIPRLAAAHSSPCVSKLSSQNTSCRPSLGWQTLASTSNLSAGGAISSQCITRGRRSASEDATSKVQVEQPAANRVSPSSASYWSGDSEDLYNWNDDASTKERSRHRSVARQISERRRTRMRLKLKRNSQSQSKLCATDLSSAHGSFHTARAPSQDRISVVEPSPLQNAAKMESQEEVSIGSGSNHVGCIALKEQTPKVDQAVTSPDIPNRRSSVVAIATQRVKHSVDMARKMSVRTMRSHHSNASVVEPINSTRLSALAPHLSTPDLGPPLTPMSLNMNFAFPPVPATAAPGLRTTQSFFSDDSSAVRNPRGSFRKRFNLPSLRSVLPSSPRAQSIANAAGKNSESAQSKLHHSCQMQALKQDGEVEEESDLYGTVGMSEFAYCRRRVLERVKGWWRKNRQRKLCLTRRKGERYQAQGA